MNPLDLRGPVFLFFYVVTFLILLAIAALLRRYLRQPGDDPAPKALSLTPYEAAYLQGGEELTVNAALARLVHTNVLVADATRRTVSAGVGGPPTNATPLEAGIYVAVKERAYEIPALRDRVASYLKPVKQQLQDMELVVADSQAGIARFVPLALVLAVPLLGIIKIGVGISRDKPVLFLVVLCAASVAISVFLLGRAVHRSRRGDRALALLMDENSALPSQVAHRVQSVSGDDLVMALGLFGMGILYSTPLAHLQTAVLPPPPANSGGSCSGGSSCSSGSSCGSGCGGGCGGGGCGGCGG